MKSTKTIPKTQFNHYQALHINKQPQEHVLHTLESQKLSTRP